MAPKLSTNHINYSNEDKLEEINYIKNTLPTILDLKEREKLLNRMQFFIVDLYREIEDINLLQEWVELISLRTMRNSSIVSHHRTKLIRKFFELKGEQVRIVKEKTGELEFEGGYVSLTNGTITQAEIVDGDITKNFIRLMNEKRGLYIATGGDGRSKAIIRLVDNSYPFLKPNEYKFLVSNTREYSITTDESLNFNGYGADIFPKSFGDDLKIIISLDPGTYSCVFYEISFPKKEDYIYAVICKATNTKTEEKIVALPELFT